MSVCMSDGCVRTVCLCACEMSVCMCAHTCMRRLSESVYISNDVF